MEKLDYQKIQKFNQKYKENPQNKIIENAIKNVGIHDFCLNNDIINHTNNLFNIELAKSKIYDQGNSERCWIYAGINLIKNNIAHNLHIEENEYALSANFISFLDKLEKSNALYQYVIEKENFDYKTEIKKDYLKLGIYEGGYFEYFRSLVNKYGIVPECVMPEVRSSKKPFEFLRIFGEKVKKDVFQILTGKKEKKKVEEMITLKEKMLEENYEFLDKCLGELPFSFDYEYTDQDGNYKKLTNLTPIQFKEKFLTTELDQFVGIANVPSYNKKYHQLYRKKYSKNIYEKEAVEFINMPITTLKDLVVKQLRDGIPVYVGCNMTKMVDNKLGIMDTNLYNYHDVFGINFLTKEEALSMYDISYQHCMLITGVHIEDDHIIRWKIEDSYGDQTHKNGYFVMNDNFFDEFVLEVMIDKKYLTEEELALFKQKPILFDMDDPF